jgi:hypothetical protein
MVQIEQLHLEMLVNAGSLETARARVAVGSCSGESR